MEQPQHVRDWSSLHADIITQISDRLTNTSDHRRFRSVCTSWRTSVSPHKPPPLHFPLKIPLYTSGCITEYGYLTRSTFYLISDNNNNKPTQDNVWITRVAETHGPPNYWSLQNPMSYETQFLPMPDVKGTKVSFLDRNVTEIAASYSMLSEGWPNVVKLVLFPIPEQQGFSLLALTRSGYLKLWNSGEKVGEAVPKKRAPRNWERKWRIVPVKGCHTCQYGKKEWKIEPKKNGCEYVDVIVYENEFYATDGVGRLMVIDPFTLESRDVITSGVDGCDEGGGGNTTYLVESNGKLYLVNKRVALNQIDVLIHVTEQETKETVCSVGQSLRPEAKDLAVWVLSQGETGLFWNPTLSLDDRVFFVSPYVTFSVSGKEIGWEGGDCIFFTDDWFRGHDCRVSFDGGDCQSSDHTYTSEHQMISQDCGIFDVPKGTITFACENTSCRFAKYFTIGVPLASPFKIFWPVPKWLISD